MALNDLASSASSSSEEDFRSAYPACPWKCRVSDGRREPPVKRARQGAADQCRDAGGHAHPVQSGPPQAAGGPQGGVDPALDDHPEQRSGRGHVGADENGRPPLSYSATNQLVGSRRPAEAALGREGKVAPTSVP